MIAITEKTTIIVAVDTETCVLENYFPAFFNQNQYLITTKERVIESAQILRPRVLILHKAGSIEETIAYINEAKELRDMGCIKRIGLITDLRTRGFILDLGLDIILYRPITEYKIGVLKKNINSREFVEISP